MESLYSQFAQVLNRYSQSGTKIVLAFSGGVDSRLLLELLSRYRQAHSIDNQLTDSHSFKCHAVYVHHGLQNISNAKQIYSLIHHGNGIVRNNVCYARNKMLCHKTHNAREIRYCSRFSKLRENRERAKLPPALNDNTHECKGGQKSDEN